MKTYKATFFRSNQKITGGGYQTTRYYEAETIEAAHKRALDYEARNKCTGLRLLRIRLAEQG